MVNITKTFRFFNSVGFLYMKHVTANEIYFGYIIIQLSENCFIIGRIAYCSFLYFAIRSVCF